MSTSYSREDIVDLAVTLINSGVSLEDVIAAAANYGVDLAAVYYSDPGTTVTVDVPADTGPVDTGPVYSEPVYSEPVSSGFEDVIVDPRSSSLGSGPVETFVYNEPVIENVPAPDTSSVTSGPVESPLSTVSSGSVDNRPIYTQEQYQAAGQFIAQNIDKPEVIAQVAQNLGLSTQDILAAAQTVNTGVTTGDVENYLTKATSPVDTGPVDTGSVDTGPVIPGPIVSGPVDTGIVDTGPVDTGFVDTTPVIAAPAAPSLADRYTPEQYAATGEWLLKNIDDPAAIKQKAAELGVKVEELAKAAQTVNPDITVADVTNYINRTPEQAAFTQTQVNEAVLTALQNGMTTAEIKEIAEELKVPTASIDNAFVKLVGNQSDADIIKGVSALTTTGSITFENIVAYADENKLPYATVANALKSTFKNTTQEQILDSMVYEKDRQQFSALEKPALDKDGKPVLDAKGNPVITVNLGDAIAQSIKQGISPENLAKFYGKSEDEFKDLVNTNLKQVATTLRTAGIDAQQGLTDLLGVDKSATQTALRDVDISNKLQDLQKDNLTYSEILGVAKENDISITDFVNKYLGGEEKEKTALKEALTAESQFTPQEQALRDAYRGLEAAPTMQQVLDYQSKQKLSDADMERIFGEFTKVTAKDLDNYRVSTALQGYSGEDKQLSYQELAQFAKDNNMDLSKVVSYVGTSESQPEILKNLQAYVKDEEFKQSLSGTELTDYQGKKYAASDLMKLAEQVKQNFDLKSSSGGVYKTEGQSVGFDYDEAKKLFPEGKAPTTVDQVALDMARGLLQQGITDVSELAKYKPTEVTYSEPSPEGGGTIERTETKYIDPATGKEFVPYLGATYTGEGGTNYQVKVDESGKPVFSTTFEDTSDKQEVGMVLAFAAAVVAPQILPELIGSTVGGVELAMLGGEAVAGTGLTGSLMAAGVPASIAPYAASMVVNGTFNGVMAEASGGDFNKGFASGIAPVIGQITANAVNSALAEFNLPAGIDKAAGNAVMQLVAKGEIDPTQVITAGVAPTLSKAIQDATGLNAAQTKLVLDTVVTQGKNLEALMNPSTAVNFVMQNKGLFDNLGLDAASGAKNIQTGQAVDLGAFNEGEIKQLQSTPTEPVFDDTLRLDTVTGLGEDTITPVKEDVITQPTVTQPIGLDTSSSITTPSTKPSTTTNVIDEFLGYDSAIKAAEALASGATQFEGVEAVQRFNEARAAGALDFQGYDMAKLEASLIANQKTQEKAREAAETLYGKGASYSYGGKFYEGEQQMTVLRDASGKETKLSKEATLITNSSGGVTGYIQNGVTYELRDGSFVPKGAVEAPGSAEVPQARLENGMYTVQGFQAAGGGKSKEDYDRYVVVANDLISKGYNASGVNPTGFNSQKALEADMSTRAGVVATSAGYTQPTQAPLSSYRATASSLLNGFGHLAMVSGSAGANFASEALNGLGQTEMADRLKQASTDAFYAARNIVATSPDAEKTLAVSSGLLSGLSIILTGGSVWATGIAPTLVATNEAYLDGKDRGLDDVTAYQRALGVGMAEYVGETIANKVLLGAIKPTVAPGTSVAIRESLTSEMSKLPFNATKAELASMVGTWAKINGVEQLTEAVTTALQMANDQIYGITDTTPTTAEGWAKLAASQFETVFGATNIALGLGGGAFAASRAANLGLIDIQIADKLSQKEPDTKLDDVLDVVPVTKPVELLTDSNNKAQLNADGTPIVIKEVVNEPALDVVSGDPIEISSSQPAQSVFDVVLNNEDKGYVVTSVDLNGNTFNITNTDGSTATLNAQELQNNALNIITQADPAALETLKSEGSLVSDLSNEVAKSVNINAIAGELQTGDVITSNDKGALVLTNDGSVAFVPNTEGKDGLVVKTGDQVTFGNGSVTVSQSNETVGATSNQGTILLADPETKTAIVETKDGVDIIDTTMMGDVKTGDTIVVTDTKAGGTPVETATKEGSTLDLSGLDLSGLDLSGIDTSNQLPVIIPSTPPVDTSSGLIGDTKQDMGSPIVGDTVVDTIPIDTGDTTTLLPPIITLPEDKGIDLETPPALVTGDVLPAVKDDTLGITGPTITVGEVVKVDPDTKTAIIDTGSPSPTVVTTGGIDVKDGSSVVIDPKDNTVVGVLPDTKVDVTPPTPPVLDTKLPDGNVPTGPIVVNPAVTLPGGLGVDTVPTGADTLPVGGLDLLPGPTTVPGVGVDTIPAIGADTIPGIGADTIPAVGADTVPAAGGDKTSGGGTKAVQFPALYLPFGTVGQQGYTNYGYPVVGPPELYGTYEMPYPNYLRPLDPYLGYGLAALMGNLYAQEQGNGGNQSLQNAQGQSTTAPR